jgi:hypothetical protein
MNKKEREILRVVLYDVEAMFDSKTEPTDFKYHYNLAKGNLRDLLNKKYAR